MSDSSHKLLSILAEEQQRGFDDATVIGGLETFLPRWSKLAQSELQPPALVTDINAYLVGYSGMSADDRRTAVNAVVRRIREQPAVAPQAAVVPQATTEEKPAAPRQPRRPRGTLDSPVTAVYRVGEQTEKQFARVGVISVRDLLHYFPRRHDDYSALKSINQLRLGDEVTVIATLMDVGSRAVRNGQRITTALFNDGTGTIRATWWNQRSLEERLRRQQEYIISGKVGQHLGYLAFQSPDWESFTPDPLDTGRMVPIYPLTEGLHQKRVRRAVRAALDDFGDQMAEPLPTSVLEGYSLPGYRWSVGMLHFPDDWETLDRARKRLAFDEFLMLQLGMLQRKRAALAADSTPLHVADSWLEAFESGLPFRLTGAQQRALSEIRSDLAQPHPMARLLQGDVGSGKTVVALAAMLIAVANGQQAALMAPTEILAEQHYRTITRLLESGSGAPFAAARTTLLVGSMPAQDKADAQAAVASGEANVVIGTHALIQDKVAFANLGLVIVDEQHRFGVEQRAQLTDKGQHPHLLAMSATPIPRTLALTLFGDMDLSAIDEMPPGRQRIMTKLFVEADRERVYDHIRREVLDGHQAFVVCPVIDAAEDGDVKAVTDEHERLQQRIFPDLKVGLLHGRMPSEQKDEVMQQFARCELDILVSTSVVEVGIDVPNATVMMVEEAHRFGLAQLHQFRGRVGRGSSRSYCILMSDCAGDLGERRLRAIEKETNGFRLAEIDLQLRGPGEFFGTRQSGLPDLRVAQLSDLRTLERARSAAEALLDSDPELAAPENAALADSLERFWHHGTPAV
ncbi:MAG: ATP-dependent DNA helicase RecG [Anaerolineae bacterium]